MQEGGEKKKRKKDHKVNEIEQQNNRGTLGDINAATTFRIHFPQNFRLKKQERWKKTKKLISQLPTCQVEKDVKLFDRE